MAVCVCSKSPLHCNICWPLKGPLNTITANSLTQPPLLIHLGFNSLFFKRTICRILLKPGQFPLKISPLGWMDNLLSPNQKLNVPDNGSYKMQNRAQELAVVSKMILNNRIELNLIYWIVFANYLKICCHKYTLFTLNELIIFESSRRGLSRTSMEHICRRMKGMGK